MLSETGRGTPADTGGRGGSRNMVTKKQAYNISAGELAALGKEKIPKELVSNTHLIYSSPATLAFNSPGAQGYGVKRAGLSIPGSVMLLVSPGCCGRNTQLLNAPGGLGDKFFYLLQDEKKALNVIKDDMNEECKSCEIHRT